MTETVSTMQDATLRESALLSTQSSRDNHIKDQTCSADLDYQFMEFVRIILIPHVTQKKRPLALLLLRLAKQLLNTENVIVTLREALLESAHLLSRQTLIGLIM